MVEACLLGQEEAPKKKAKGVALCLQVLVLSALSCIWSCEGSQTEFRASVEANDFSPDESLHTYFGLRQKDSEENPEARST